MSDYSKSALTQFENTSYSKILTILNFIPWNTFSFGSFIQFFKPVKATELLSQNKPAREEAGKAEMLFQLTKSSLPSSPTGQQHLVLLGREITESQNGLGLMGL